MSKKRGHNRHLYTTVLPKSKKKKKIEENSRKIVLKRINFHGSDKNVGSNFVEVQ